MPRRTILVTGATRGIGFEVARELGRAGRRIIVTGRDERSISKACKELDGDGVVARGQRLDVASVESIQECAVALKDTGEQVDVLVNNAATYPPGSLFDTPPEVLRSTFETNF